MPDYHELDKRIDVAGHLPTEINAAAVELIGSGKISALDLAPLLSPLAKIRDALVRIQDWSTDAQKPPNQTPAPQPVPPTGEQPGDSWSQYKGPIPASSLSDEDAYLFNASMSDSQHAFDWKGIVGGTESEIKRLVRVGVEDGRLKMDTRAKVAAYAAKNTPLYSAYLDGGGKPLA